MACDAMTQIGQALCRPVGKRIRVKPKGVKKTTVAGPRGSITKIKGV